MAEYSSEAGLAPMDLEERAEKAEENGDLETARTLWKEIAARNQDATSFVSYGRLATRTEEWGEAQHAFEQALRLDPNFWLAMEGMGVLWYERTDKDDAEAFQTARDWYLKAIKLDRNAGALTLLGCSYSALGDSIAAQAAFEEAIQIDPQYRGSVLQPCCHANGE
jgi:tetratricopeptide (TPR) repeat protein